MAGGVDSQAGGEDPWREGWTLAPEGPDVQELLADVVPVAAGHAGGLGHVLRVQQALQVVLHLVQPAKSPPQHEANSTTLRGIHHRGEFCA
eukprot:8077133-Pyramimonas_sp.AAC.1